MEESADWEILSHGINDILLAIESHNYQQSRDIMGQYVSGFTPDVTVVDWLSFKYPDEPVVDIKSKETA